MADKPPRVALLDLPTGISVGVLRERLVAHRSIMGHKSDVRDCEWLAALLRHGLLRGSIVPARQRELRQLVRATDLRSSVSVRR